MPKTNIFSILFDFVFRRNRKSECASKSGQKPLRGPNIISNYVIDDFDYVRVEDIKYFRVGDLKEAK